MKIRNRLNGGHAEVTDEYADRLVKGGVWQKVEDTPKPAPARRTRKAAEPQPEEAPVTEE